MKCCIVYCHTNRLNGKRYVGWVVVKPEQAPYDAMMRRCKVHCKNQRDDLVARAVRKHGSEAFDHEVLEVMTTREGAKHAEKLWITECKLCVVDRPDTCYNMTRGGDGGGLLGRVFSPEHRARISATLTGKPMKSEAREHLSRVKRGKPNTFKGKHHSTESKALLAESHSKLTSKHQNNAQDIIAREANRTKVRVTQHQLAAEHNVSQSAINRLLSGQTWGSVS